MHVREKGSEVKQLGLRIPDHDLHGMVTITFGRLQPHSKSLPWNEEENVTCVWKTITKHSCSIGAFDDLYNVVFQCAEPKVVKDRDDNNVIVITGYPPHHNYDVQGVLVVVRKHDPAAVVI